MLDIRCIATSLLLYTKDQDLLTANFLLTDRLPVMSKSLTGMHSSSTLSLMFISIHSHDLRFPFSSSSCPVVSQRPEEDPQDHVLRRPGQGGGSPEDLQPGRKVPSLPSSASPSSVSSPLWSVAFRCLPSPPPCPSGPLCCVGLMASFRAPKAVSPATGLDNNMMLMMIPLMEVSTFVDKELEKLFYDRACPAEC